MSPDHVARRILVIEDAASDRERIGRLLTQDRESRYEVVFAVTLGEGVALAQGGGFDLALVDWALPDGSGAGLGAHLERAGVSLPFVLMAGQERSRQVYEALALGAVDLVSKQDLTAPVLMRVCELAIVRARLRQELETQALVRARLYEEASRRAEFEQRLLAIIGHDLRTPLSAIFTAVHLLQIQYPDEPLLELLERSARRMGEMIRDVMARSEAVASARSEGVEEAAPTEVSAAVQEAVQELQAAFPAHQIVIASGPEALFTALDATRLAQAIANLVRNAVQHGAAGRPVTISFAADEQQVVVRVHNEGAVIPAEAMSTLFDPFRRGGHAGGRGAGLGLFIVHEIMTLVGGSVRVESCDEGTTFSLLVPRSPAP